MGRWLLAAALVLPLAARADPPRMVEPADGAWQPPQPTRAQSYAPQPPADATARYAGWGMRATIRGRSIDLNSLRAGWAQDPDASPADIEAGYGWRKGSADAVLGYGEFGSENSRDGADSRLGSLRHPVGARGVLGFSFVLHGR